MQQEELSSTTEMFKEQIPRTAPGLKGLNQGRQGLGIEAQELQRSKLAPKE